LIGENNMQKKFKKRVSCRNKVRHQNRAGALIAAKIVFIKSKLIVRPYKCARCNFWHTGKPSFYDDAYTFWHNIMTQMTTEERDKLLKEKRK
jgi:hypothetical protein